jgi:hypothetical protein
MSAKYFVGKRPFCSVKALASKVVVFLVLDQPEPTAGGGLTDPQDR